MQNKEISLDLVSNKNDMIIDVLSDIICEDYGIIVGKDVTPEEQIECRLRFGSLHEVDEYYREIKYNEKK